MSSKRVVLNESRSVQDPEEAEATGPDWPGEHAGRADRGREKPRSSTWAGEGLRTDDAAGVTPGRPPSWHGD